MTSNSQAWGYHGTPLRQCGDTGLERSVLAEVTAVQLYIEMLATESRLTSLLSGSCVARVRWRP